VNFRNLLVLTLSQSNAGHRGFPVGKLTALGTREHDMFGKLLTDIDNFPAAAKSDISGS
jgi:hypothetical protein